MIAMEAGDRLGEASGPLALDVTSLATSPGRSAFPVLPVPPHPDIRVQNTDDYAVRPSNYHKSPRLQHSGIQTKRDRAVTFRVPAQPGATFRPEHTAPARATCTPRARRASTSIVGGEQTHGRSDGSPKPYRYHVRPPSLINLTILEDMCLGHKVADAIIILGSVDIVLGEVDR